MAARTQRIDAHGPFPADGFFAFGTYRSFDGILAMYHDQGLIPLKLLAKGAGVNVTAGLRVVRTSPDHGTAYDRALADDVDAASTREALEMAVTIADRRANH
jgi:4-hydroxythreonine-4-phosphate dehydrogenase